MRMATDDVLVDQSSADTEVNSCDRLHGRAGVVDSLLLNVATSNLYMVIEGADHIVPATIEGCGLGKVEMPHIIDPVTAGDTRERLERIGVGQLASRKHSAESLSRFHGP